MKIIIAGANGFLGRALARHFASRGDEVVGLVRRAGGGDAGFRPVRWDGRVVGEWAAELDGADALINLAGRSVNCRYHQRNRDDILRSRTDSTRILGDAIALCQRPPAVWINSSTATIYRHAEDRAQDEHGGDLGEGFSVEVARAWERTFFAARIPGPVRKVAVRTAIVMANEPGTVFAYLRNLARFGLGGPMGSGRQMVSWIHVEDFCRAIDWLLTHRDCDGIVNLAAPGPVSNRVLMRTVRRAVGMRLGLPAGKLLLELGALALGTETELVLKSRWVRPARLLSAGFHFRWPEIGPAVADLLTGRNPPGTAEKFGSGKMKTLCCARDELE